MLILRSLLFNVLFYLMLLVYLVAAIPTFFLPRRAIIRVAQSWGRANIWLLDVVCGMKIEVRGAENLPSGPIILASKHQSAWEIFALVPMVHDPIFILKRELQWLPMFGWYTMKAQMIPVDRGGGSRALLAVAQRATVQLAEGRQLLIFPEGTRRAPGAEPRYKYGVAHLYHELKVPCVPAALNSGLFWARRSILRRPGTVVLEVLPPIMPGMDKEAFLTRLQDEIETASNRLLAEGLRQLPDHALHRNAPVSSAATR